MLSGSAANCWEDILKWKLNHLQETKKAVINRLLGNYSMLIYSLVDVLVGSALSAIVDPFYVVDSFSRKYLILQLLSCSSSVIDPYLTLHLKCGMMWTFPLNCAYSRSPSLLTHCYLLRVPLLITHWLSNRN